MAYVHLSVCVVLFVSMWSTSSAIASCTYKDSTTGKVYDFTSLVNPAGYYTFQQRVWSIGGFSLDSLSADTQVNITFYLQVCQNILVRPPGCEDIGAAYSVTSDGKCQSWGDANIAVFDPNPYKDGANLKMYHGTMIDHITFNAAHVYFVCNQGHPLKAEAPFFEHVKAANNQAHFKFFTHLAC